MKMPARLAARRSQAAVLSALELLELALPMFAAPPPATFLLLALILVPFMAESFAPERWRVRRFTSDHLSFCGRSLLSKPWTPVTSSFLHDTASHTAKELMPLLLLGGAIERAIGPAASVGAFVGTGAVACVASWLLLRRRLLADPEYAAWARSDVAAIADHAESRGASSSIYGIATFGAIVAGPSACFGPAALSFFAPLIHDGLRWNRQQKRVWRNRADWWALMLAFCAAAWLLLGDGGVGAAAPSVLVCVSWYFGFNVLRQIVDTCVLPPRAADGLQALGVASTDWESHLCGAMLGVVGGWALTPQGSAGGMDRLIAILIVLVSALFDR